jgi:alpha-galactosidase
MPGNALNEKVVLIGAGSVSFTRGLLADILKAGWTGEIWLVDTNPEAARVAEGLARKMTPGRGLAVHGTTDRREALPGATAVVCTVGVGGRRGWEQDVFVPRRFGIFQPVGDSVMPGGTSRALRMIPAMAGVAEDVLKLAPRALFFNYGNPMSAVCRGVAKATGAGVVGLCHGVLDSARHLAGLLGVPFDGFGYTGAGINHLTWLTRVGSEGADLMPRLVALARERASRKLAPEEFGLMEWGGDRVTLPQDQPFTWELVAEHGAYPVPGDRHITEFYPERFGREGAYYGKTLGRDAYTFEGVIAAGDAGYEEMKRTALSPDPLPDGWLERSGGEHEQVVEIIGAIRRDRRLVCSANLPNRGQVPNLPRDAVVETTCLVDGSGVRPVLQEPLPAAIAERLARRLEWAEATVEAALEGSRERFVSALLLDGAVSSRETAGRLADEMLAAHREHLPRFRR